MKPKLISYLSAKPGLTREAFIDHYENRHVPLVRKLLPMIGAYRRSYLDMTLLPFSAATPEYDVVTEMVFDDEKALAAYWHAVSEADVLQEIRADLALFVGDKPPLTVAGWQHD
jgi:uncharacterized protein (TIGR02118 family)